MAQETKVAPYGTWESPISKDLISGNSNSFSEVHVHPTNGTIYLVEGRPADNGRCALVEIIGDKSTDVLPAEYDIRTRVHEYGGAAAAMSPDGALLFSDVGSGGVFRFKSGADIQPLVKAIEEFRYADFNAHPKNSNWILAVKEDHTKPLPSDVVNTVVLINAGAKSTETILSGADFYIHPSFSKDGKWIAWVQWMHPDMPWTGTELYAAEWSNGKIGKPRYIAGKAGKESAGSPIWLSNGRLLFNSDRTGFSQLYMFDPTSFGVRKVEVKGYEDTDLGGRESLGTNPYIELNTTTLIVTYTREASDGLLLVGIASKQVFRLPLEMVSINNKGLRRVSNSEFIVVGTEAKSPTALYLIGISPPKLTVLRSSTSIPLDPSIFSKTQHITFPRTSGKGPKGYSYAIFVPPHNPGYAAPKGTKPPLIVNIHGGPTGNSTLGLSLTTQYWTSRGYAYVFVNYAGSTGYGREYWESLNYYWGIKDIDDAASCVSYLASEGLVNGSKVGIVGGSAGGYTVLKALVSYPKLYAGGNSLFGVSDLQMLAEGTHKFESHYLYALLFKPDATEEEKAKVYHDRSPCFHAKEIQRPLLLLQGDIDRVVPIKQATEMERVMRENGGDVKLVVMKGEGHGFRMQKHIIKATEEEEALWKRTLL